MLVSSSQEHAYKNVEKTLFGIHKPSIWQLFRPAWGSSVPRKASWITDLKFVPSHYLRVFRERRLHPFSPVSLRNSPQAQLDPDCTGITEVLAYC